MAMGPERSSKPLHNFTLPYLKWGNQRHLRCMKVEDSSTTVSDQRPRRRSPPSRLISSSSSVINRRESDGYGSRPRLGGGGAAREKSLLKLGMDNGGSDDGEGIGAAREKIMNNFKTAAYKMKDAILREEELSDDEKEVSESPPPPPPLAAASVQVNSEVRPWNLRTRRAACKAPIGGGWSAATTATMPTNKGLKIEERKANYSPMRTEVGANSPRLLRSEKEIKKERPKFAVSLSKKEIEEDFMKMAGHRPLRRPKKRPRAVQKQLDSLFPGLWLAEVTADDYKVPEEAENGKR